jgi:xanthine dehydrogenase YagT iron-sulfur-binding subunit
VLGSRGPGPVPVRLSINGLEHAVTIEPCVSLLDALRERRDGGRQEGLRPGDVRRLHGLGRRQAGPVLPDVAVACEGHQVTRIEGLADVAMPLLTRLLRPWLYPPARRP